MVIKITPSSFTEKISCMTKMIMLWGLHYCGGQEANLQVFDWGVCFAMNLLMFMCFGLSSEILNTYWRIA